MKNVIVLIACLFAWSLSAATKPHSKDFTSHQQHLLILEKAMLKHLGLTREWSANAQNRARSSGFAPKLSVFFHLDKDQDIRHKIPPSTELTKYEGQALDFRVGLSINFDFGATVFNYNELKIAQIELQQHKERQRIISQFHSQFFSFHQQKPSVKKQKTFAWLNSVTAGQFGKLYEY